MQVVDEAAATVASFLESSRLSREVTVKTNYVGHDQLYKDYKAEGRPGWDTQEDMQKQLAFFARMFENPLIPRSGRVVELGCGAGNYSVWLAQRGYHVDAIDIAPTAIAWAKERALAEGVDVDFQVGSVLTLTGYADDHYDLALDWHCLHCIIGDDRAQFLRNVHRVLKPGGVLVSHTMCGDKIPEDVQPQFQPATRTVVYGEAHMRYVGWPEDILAEFGSADLDVLHSEVDSEDGDDSLLTIARKPS